MAKELEVKVLNIDKKEMEERLVSIGAKYLVKEEQINTLIDTKTKNIENELDSYLRIRETKNLDTGEEQIIFTLKENISREGIRENIEANTFISNKKTLIYILNRLGYEVVEEGYKERISYVYNDIRFDIDTWDEKTYPYTYMEIEVKKKEDLDKAIRLLNIDKEQITTKSIVDLRKELEK